MDKYQVLNALGDGAFGQVYRAKCIETGEIVALKIMKEKFQSWEECLQLRELKSLKSLRHENIVQLKQVIREKEQLVFVFEYLHSNLFQTLKQNDLSKGEIRSILFQLFSALAYIHKHGYFHRDIKPENILVQDRVQIKLADFGLARETRSCPPLTDYVSTRWYRSPELLLNSTSYNSPIDIWASGCIMAEFFLGKCLFTGTSDMDQLCQICNVLGTPTKETWAEGLQKVATRSFNFPKCDPIPFETILPRGTEPEAISLLTNLLCYDSSKRPTAAQALQHPYFDSSRRSAPIARRVSSVYLEETESPLSVDQLMSEISVASSPEKPSTAEIDDEVFDDLLEQVLQG